MDLTATKKRYLLSIALLKDHPQQTFRPIELAIRLGVSRASVSRMILSFVKTGLLAQNRHGYRLGHQRGCCRLKIHCRNTSNTSIFRSTVLHLSKYDAQECSISSLLSSAETQTLRHLSHSVSSFLLKCSDH